MKAIRHALALTVLAAALAAPTHAAEPVKAATRSAAVVKKTENYVTTRDGVQLYYKE
ncbi:MAG: hypothetical protein JNK71_12410 [Methyloversatilis sp.]|nr:hypothetical protein [Methyloversatilis sp.]